METAKLKAEYEEQLAEMKEKYQAEQMSKQKLQEEMEKLQTNYNRQVHDIEDQYSQDAASASTSVGGAASAGSVALVTGAQQVSLKHQVQIWLLCGSCLCNEKSSHVASLGRNLELP